MLDPAPLQWLGQSTPQCPSNWQGGQRLGGGLEFGHCLAQCPYCLHLKQAPSGVDVGLPFSVGLEPWVVEPCRAFASIRYFSWCLFLRSSFSCSLLWKTLKATLRSFLWGISGLSSNFSSFFLMSGADWCIKCECSNAIPTGEVGSIWVYF